MNGAISVIITHHSPLFREGLTRVLKSPLFHSVQASAEFDETSQNFLSSPGHTLWVMCHSKAVDLHNLRQVKIKFPELMVVVLSESPEIEIVLQALESGASGFLNHDIGPEHLLKALELVALGEMVVPAKSLQIFVKQAHLQSQQESEKDSVLKRVGNGEGA